MKQIDGQMTLDGCKVVKPLIYSLSLTCFKTVCPHCKMDNPDSTVANDCTRRGFNRRDLPFSHLPLNFCPNCGKEFDRDNCEVRMTRDFMDQNEEYVQSLWKDEKGKWRERRPE